MKTAFIKSESGPTKCTDSVFALDVHYGIIVDVSRSLYMEENKSKAACSRAENVLNS